MRKNVCKFVFVIAFLVLAIFATTDAFAKPMLKVGISSCTSRYYGCIYEYCNIVRSEFYSNQYKPMYMLDVNTDMFNMDVDISESRIDADIEIGYGNDNIRLDMFADIETINSQFEYNECKTGLRLSISESVGIFTFTTRADISYASIDYETLYYNPKTFLFGFNAELSMKYFKIGGEIVSYQHRASSGFFKPMEVENVFYSEIEVPLNWIGMFYARYEHLCTHPECAWDDEILDTQYNLAYDIICVGLKLCF